MGTEDFPCPKCPHLNTTRSIACKNCGADLKQVSHCIAHIEKVVGRRSTQILNFIIAVAILGIIIAVAVPKAFSRSIIVPLSVARGIGAAIDGSIQAKHSDYLSNGDKYTLDDVLAGTAITGGITYNTTPNNTPAMREICSNVAGTAIILNYMKGTYVWDYIPRNGDTAAKIVESGDFGKAVEIDSTLDLIITFVVLLGFIIVVSIPFYFKNPPFNPTSATRADLNKALKKIRNACISGLVTAGCFSLFFIVRPSITGNIIRNIENIIFAFLITAVLFGLSFGVYKRSCFCAIGLFMSMLCCLMLCIYVSMSSQITSLEKMYIGVGCMLAYFTFEGIRGTVTYHKLFKTIQEKIKALEPVLH